MSSSDSSAGSSSFFSSAAAAPASPLAAAPPAAGAAAAPPPELDTLRRDYLSLLTLVYTSATKVSLALRPAEPAFGAAVPQLSDLVLSVCFRYFCHYSGSEYLRMPCKAYSDELLQVILLSACNLHVLSPEV